MTMDTTHESPYYSTKDTPLAAYLYASGIELLYVDHHADHHALFIFARPDDKLLADYTSGKALVNALAFYHAYRRLVRLAKERKDA